MQSKRSPKRSEKSQFKHYFLPLIILLAMLPILVLSVVFGFSDVLFTRADSPPTVRAWIEPSTVIVASGQTVTLKAMAAIEPKNIIIPSLTFTVFADPALSISPVSLQYNKPLQGQTIIGEISVTAAEKGRHTIGISEQSVLVGGNFNPTVSSTNATIIVQ
jgi:hypothetical protein